MTTNIAFMIFFTKFSCSCNRCWILAHQNFGTQYEKLRICCIKQSQQQILLQRQCCWFLSGGATLVCVGVYLVSFRSIHHWPPKTILCRDIVVLQYLFKCILPYWWCETMFHISFFFTLLPSPFYACTLHRGFFFLLQKLYHCANLVKRSSTSCKMETRTDNG